MVKPSDSTSFLNQFSIYKCLGGKEPLKLYHHLQKHFERAC